MITPPDWYLIAKRQLELEQRQPLRRRRPPAEEITVLRSPRPRRAYASVTHRRTVASDQDRRDRTFCAVLGAVLFASCVPVWLATITCTLVVTGQITV